MRRLSVALSVGLTAGCLFPDTSGLSNSDGGGSDATTGGDSAPDVQAPGIYSVGTWVQICQTYAHASMTRTVVVNGQTSQKFVVTDAAPIVESSSSSWCIGSYNLGGFWTGRIYLPMWFNRALGDTEIQQVYTSACCLP